MDVQERQAHFKHLPRFLSPGWRPKPILPHTKRRPNSKVSMSRRASALEAFRHNPTDGGGGDGDGDGDVNDKDGDSDGGD